MILDPHTVSHPRTMMIHSLNASFTFFTMMSSNWFHSFTLKTIWHFVNTFNYVKCSWGFLPFCAIISLPVLDFNIAVQILLLLLSICISWFLLSLHFLLPSHFYFYFSFLLGVSLKFLNVLEMGIDILCHKSRRSPNSLPICHCQE